ncbi:hypothetical protein ACI2LF_21005 [Kribbella sp. NPDC020789]
MRRLAATIVVFLISAILLVFGVELVFNGRVAPRYPDRSIVFARAGDSCGIDRPWLYLAIDTGEELRCETGRPAIRGMFAPAGSEAAKVLDLSSGLGADGQISDADRRQIRRLAEGISTAEHRRLDDVASADAASLVTPGWIMIGLGLLAGLAGIRDVHRGKAAASSRQRLVRLG